MMKDLTAEMQKTLTRLTSQGKRLYRVAVTGEELWNVYLSSFDKPGVFRDPSSNEYNCNLCNNFMRRYGNIVGVENNKLVSLFNVESAPEKYKTAAENLARLVESSYIENIFVESYSELYALNYSACKKNDSVFRLGLGENKKIYTQEEADKYPKTVEVDKVYTFGHLHVDMPKEYINFSANSNASIMSVKRSDREVFQGMLGELQLSTIDLVLELIEQGSLLNAESYVEKVKDARGHIVAYHQVPEENRTVWVWETVTTCKYPKFYNELIGELCKEIARGETLEKACSNWNKRVDPANYMKAVAPLTKAQKEKDQKFLIEKGYVASFDRRFATLDDIAVSEIKHLNNKESKTLSVFDKIATTNTGVTINEKSLTEISINDFLTNIVPTATSIEAFLENRHKKQMVSLSTAVDANSKPMFKWGNNYSWTYSNNLAGQSFISEQVEKAGGSLEGVLRFSLTWSEGNSSDESDLDAHCLTPGNGHIYFGNKLVRSGSLDVDIMSPSTHKRKGLSAAVENIVFTKVDSGVYTFYVNQYASRNSKGFKAELIIGYDKYEYSYDKPVSGSVNIAEVTYTKDGTFKVKHLLQPTGEYSKGSKQIYGLDSQNFHTVKLLCTSPNYWVDEPIGHKHYFFMLQDCIADTELRGFHTENLNSELLEARRTMEALGAVSTIQGAEQLSGIGYNATVQNHLIVKVNNKSLYKINF